MKWHRIPKCYPVQTRTRGAWPRGASRFDDLILHSIAHNLANRVYLEFPHDIRPMSFGCLDAYSESHCDFLATLTFRQKLYDFALAGGQPVSQMSFRIGYRVLDGEAIQEHFCGARREKCSVIRQSLHRADQIPIGIRFHDVGPGAGLDNVPQKLIREVQRQK
jgi:hypothetical protein